MTTVDECKIIQLKSIRNRKGNLTPVNARTDIPFDIQRVYYLYDVPGGVSRGGHAHKQLQQVIVSVMGAFDVIVDDGWNKKTIHLDRAYYGLYIPIMIWRELDNFSSGAICLVLASQQYDEMDYYRNYEEFLKAKKQ
ncbi:MAG TPA: FdtA/QdtA family cupin domain-containing protein [Syntrophales bacterium]|nr:FdtA/QdtA family cupin domain-containing protein [Syntrophales bacterium]HQN78067.1 FdtA/QdtA family cupin domain-containing protein [Syntrophales bacterium]